MRIGVCARTWGESGGIGVYTRSVIEALLRTDHESEYRILFANAGHASALPASARVRGVVLAGHGKWLWDQWSVARYANRERLDIVLHTKLSIPFLARCRTAMVVHGTERFVHPEFHKGADLVYFRTIYPQYLRRASLIIAVSRRARDDVVAHAGIDPEKVRVAYLAADPVFRVVDDDGALAAIRARYRLPERFLLFVGHIYPGKNFGRVLRAFDMVRRQFDVDLVVAGSPRWKYQDDLALIESLGLGTHVHFTGNVPHADLVAFYNLAQAAVYPSFYESFGLVNVEANACGCPLVTSSTGGSPEAAGDAAVYVDPRDVGSIAQGVLQVLGNPDLRADLVARGIANARRFSWDATARSTLEALRWAVERR